MPINIMDGVKKFLKRMLIAIIIILVVFIAGTFIYLQHPRFGKAATGKRLERMQGSKNFKDGVFHNLENTPSFAEGYGITKTMYMFFFQKSKYLRPSKPIPSVQTNLRALPADSNLVVWFGHSSYYLQAEGKKFLVDPVFSNNASPVYLSLIHI